MSNTSCKGNIKYDVVIIGAGAIGLSLALSLSETKLKIAVVDKASDKLLAAPEKDGREIALTHFSVAILEKFGIWSELDKSDISPIKEAKVINGDSSYFLHFNLDKGNKNILGYLVSNHILRAAIYQKAISKKSISLITEKSVTDINNNDNIASVALCDGTKLDTDLVVAADGRFSKMRQKMSIAANMQDFSRTIILCEMEHKISHQNIAYECFYYGKTVAILPLSGNKSSIVITVASNLADNILNMPEKEFNQEVENWLGGRLGKMKNLGKKFSYPLIAVYAKKFVAKRFALIGDAAVGMHPVTAHGFNFGLQSQSSLAKEIKSAIRNNEDIGSKSILNRYFINHFKTTKLLYFGTNIVVNLFTNESPPAKLLRNAALRIADKLEPFKRAVTYKLTADGNNHKKIKLPFIDKFF